MQNLYSSTGRTPTRDAAKKPFRTLRAVAWIFPLPFWYSMAVSNTAMASPQENKAQPNMENSLVVAETQLRENISAPMLPIWAKNAAIAS